MNQIPKAQAARFLAQMTDDYCGELRRQGHKQAAELMKANGIAAINSLTQAESEKAVPDADEK